MFFFRTTITSCVCLMEILRKNMRNGAFARQRIVVLSELEQTDLPSVQKISLHDSNWKKKNQCHYLSNHESVH